MKKRIKNNKTKRCIIDEIIKTEINYQNGITWMVKWKNELMEEFLATKEEADIIFGNIEDIANISDAFLEIAQKRFNEWTPKSTIGDVFIQIAPYFKLYGDYCNNNEKAGEFFREKYKRETYYFKKFIDKEAK